MNNFRAYISTGVKYIIFLNNLVWGISQKRGTFRNHVKNRIDGVFKKKTYVYAALELMNKYIKKEIEFMTYERSYTCHKYDSNWWKRRTAHTFYTGTSTGWY